MHQVFNHRNFFYEFDSDLRAARFLVTIQSPFMTSKRVKSLFPILEDCLTRRVRVCVFTQEIDSRFSNNDDYAGKISTLNKVIEMLSSIGIHVNQVSRIHEKLVVIDENIFWEGSLNPLSYRDTTERMTRWQCREKAREAIAMHNLMNCSMCQKDSLTGEIQKIFGGIIARRRKMLNLSQVEFSEITGIAQATLSRIESGKSDLRLSLLSEIFSALRMDCRPILTCMTPFLDHELNLLLQMRSKE